MKFQRCGGLSAKKQKGNYEKSTFHSAPARRGVYAFIQHHTELFLVLWNEKNTEEFNRRGFRTFDYEGYVWCHFINHTKSAKRKKEWVNIHTSELEKIIRKVYSENTSLRRSNIFYGSWKKDNFEQSKHIYRPYNISLDEWEVFIEDKI